MLQSASQVSAEEWRARADAVTFETGHFIDGEVVASRSGDCFQSINPATGAVLAEVPKGGASDVDAAVASARRAYKSGVWSRMAPRERKIVLHRFADLIDEYGETLALIDSLDMGKPIAETVRLDIPISYRCTKFYAEAIDKVDGRVTNTAQNILHYVRRHPVGIVGCIVPWNYPTMMAIWKVAPALACGNTVVLKPAEESPLSSVLLARLFIEAGGPPGVFNVVNGLGAEVGKSLALHMDVDAIGFTGSVEVGKLMMVYAGESNMKRVQTECGGKTPHIIMDDVEDLGVAVDYAVHGLYENQGQMCSAGSRIMVHKSLHDEFIDRFTQRTRELYRIGDPLDPETTMGPLVTTAQRDRALKYIELGKKEGAELAFGGAVPSGYERGAYLEPSLFLNMENGMTIAREEIFGPVGGVMRFSHLAHALEMTNDSIYGLAAGIWTKDIDRALIFARDADVGIVWINSFDTGDMTAPWVAFKQSGSGRDKGLDAMDHYTHEKSVWVRLDEPAGA